MRRFYQCLSMYSKVSLPLSILGIKSRIYLHLNLCKAPSILASFCSYVFVSGQRKWEREARLLAIMSSYSLILLLTGMSAKFMVSCFRTGEDPASVLQPSDCYGWTSEEKSGAPRLENLQIHHKIFISKIETNSLGFLFLLLFPRNDEGCLRGRYRLGRRNI